MSKITVSYVKDVGKSDRIRFYGHDDVYEVVDLASGSGRTELVLRTGDWLTRVIKPSRTACQILLKETA